MSDIITLVNQQKPAIARALPSHCNADRMHRVAITALRMNPKLQQCTPDSILGCLMISSQLGLEINTPLGHAYLIPYGKECTFIVGYKGLLDLAYRTGNYIKFDAHAVYKEDEFDYRLGLNSDLSHKPHLGVREGKPICYYAYYTTKSGGSNFKVWSTEEIEAHGKKYSPSFSRSSSPWKTSFDSMAKKTVLKDLMKLAPMSPEDKEMMSRLESDNAVVNANTDNAEILQVEHKEVKELEQTSNLDEAQQKEADQAIEDLN